MQKKPSKKESFKVGDRLHDRSKHLTERQKKQYGYLPDDTNSPPNLYQRVVLRNKKNERHFKIIDGGQS